MTVAPSENTPVHEPTPTTAGTRYLATSLSCVVLFLALISYWGMHSGLFLPIPLHGDKSWYRDFAGRYRAEIHDEDVFYHNVGGSVAAVQKADIIFLGPSFVSYAMDPQLLRNFETRHHVKIYNMSFIGIRGGEFSRRVIRKWNIRPKLWIINADDQFIHFFSDELDLSLGPKTTPIPTVSYTRIRGVLNAYARNLRWRLEDAWATHLGRQVGSGIYRNTATGDVDLFNNPTYVASGNKVLVVDRDQNCHASQEVKNFGRDFVKEIGGESILMLVPHSQYCRAQATEIGQAIGKEVLLPPFTTYTTVDGGGHLDQAGARTYTSQLLSMLEQSEAFKKVIPQSKQP